MKAKIKHFLIDNNYKNLIILIGIILLGIIIARYIYLRLLLKDKVNVVQAAELRQNTILTRDQYHLQIWKQWFETSNIIVIAIHGLQGQKEDFKLISNFFRQKKWSVIAYDRRGIGKNHDYKKFHSFKTDINDTKDVIAAVKSKYPKHKIFLFGEAIGASIAVHAASNNNFVDAVITSNLITRYHLYPFSLRLYLRLLVGFIFYRNISLPFYINETEISSNPAYITNMKQRYTTKQQWTLSFMMQLKTLNKTAALIISKLKQPVLILQSGDDIFSDFHNLKILKQKWIKKQQYYFHFNGKHSLINEPEIKNIFHETICPWIEKQLDFTSK